MTKSDYIRGEHENQLLGAGYICISEKDGIQTWADMQSRGCDIEHWVCMYETFVDRMSLYSPSEAQKAGAIYFAVAGIEGKKRLTTTSVKNAIQYSRVDAYTQTR